MRLAHDLALIAALALGLGACSSAPTARGIPGSPTNATADAQMHQLIEDMRFMHGTELLGRMSALAHMGDDATQELRRSARSDDWLVRSSVMWIFGAMQDRRNVPVIFEGLGDKNPAVRNQAASSLVLLGDVRGFPVLVEGLADESVEVRFKCFESLKEATNRDFGYRHDAAPDERRLAVARWREWLEGVQANAL